MSDEQHSTPTEPYATWPQPQPRPIEPYAPAGQAQPAPYRPVAGLPATTGAYTHTTTVTARPVGSAHIAIAWVFAIVTFGYFLPWAISATRQKSNTLAIALLNLLVGWTFIGWLVALVMAVQNEPTHVTNVAYAVAPVVHTGAQSVPAGWYPDDLGVRRYWDGQRWTGHTAP